MTTGLHRLQVSLPKAQVDFLAARARREGVSIAEVVRRLVEHAAEARTAGAVESLWSIAGIADDGGELIDGTAVSERTDLYLSAEALSKHGATRTNLKGSRAK